MKALKTLAALCCTLTLPSSLSAQEGTQADTQEKADKIGTVNMQKLVNDYYKTGQTRESFKGYDADIKEEDDARVATIKALIEEARNFQKQGEDPSLSREKKEELFKQAGAKNQEAQGLVKARQEWASRKRAALSEKANVEFAALRAEIMAMVQKAGDEQGYDFILDRSGSSGAQVPILSYAKDATDLTGILIGIINKEAPKKEAKAGTSDSK